MSRMWKQTIVWIAGALLLAGNVGAQDSYVVVQGRQVPVDRIQAKPNGDLVVYVKGEPRDLKKGQYERAVSPKPAELDEAMQLLANGQNDEAKPKLQAVMRSARFLSWDVEAGQELINIQLDAKDANGAFATIKELKRRYGDDAGSVYPQLAAADWRIRIGLGNVEGLGEELTKVIRGTDRAKAAVAQMVRGDMYAKKGLLMKAQLDYLRTHLFYENEESIQPEALFKIASTFQTRGETTNARNYVNILTERYPDSRYTARAASL